MLFDSFEFLVFFVLVTTLYFILPHKWRWAHLLVASCYFYMFFIPVYILILFSTIVIDYLAGIAIEGAEGNKRKIFFTLSTITNISVLAVFKYYNFFVENANVVLSSAGSSLQFSFISIALPVGLSFHTFQAMSYTIEVYRGAQKAERHLGIYALYVMFYPQLVAGPIERPQNILYQFREKKYFSAQDFEGGIKKIIWGLFKKVVIADRLAIIVSEVFHNVSKYESHGPAYLIAVVFFAFQIFCDFSGYSDIALGCAKIMGFRLMENFNRPYSACSIAEFWSRWHISLSTWFRDYVYIPLGGNRVSTKRHYFNLSVVFIISGLWHGAAWTFVIWGALHAIFLVVEKITQRLRNVLILKTNLRKWPVVLRTLAMSTTFALVCVAWIFFRAKSVSDALQVLKGLIQGWDAISSAGYVKELITNLGQGNTVLGAFNVLFGLSVIIFHEVTLHYMQCVGSIPWVVRRRRTLEGIWYYFLCVCILTVGVYEYQEFIYFQF